MPTVEGGQVTSEIIRVLVIDDDPWSQQVISSQLVESGFRVDCAGDGWEGLILAGRAAPDLIVSEVHLPTTDGWSLAEEIRARKPLENVPFIFMADDSPGLRPGKSFRPSTDQLLAKPFTIIALRSAVERGLGERVREAGYAGSTKIIVEVPSGPHPIAKFVSHEMPRPSESWEVQGLEPALRGSLANFGLSSLLMVIELERMSGILTLDGPIGAGRLALREGRVVRARIDGDDRARGAHAIYQMLEWAKGTFAFDAGEVGGDDQIERSTSFLLMEGARLVDERAHLLKQQG
jgi:two-component system OmpR family response regulator